jgi:hypothetical protein
MSLLGCIFLVPKGEPHKLTYESSNSESQNAPSNLPSSLPATAETHTFSQDDIQYLTRSPNAFSNDNGHTDRDLHRKHSAHLVYAALTSSLVNSMPLETKSAPDTLPPASAQNMQENSEITKEEITHSQAILWMIGNVECPSSVAEALCFPAHVFAAVHVLDPFLSQAASVVMTILRGVQVCGQLCQFEAQIYTTPAIVRAQDSTRMHLCVLRNTHAP